jgi:hypothetical protein
MNIDDVLNRVRSVALNENVPRFLEQINFQCAENMPWEDYKTLDMQMKKAELLFKTYALACAKDDKPLRVQTMKVFRDLLETLPDALIKYRKHVKEHLEEKKCEEKKKSECGHK